MSNYKTRAFLTSILLAFFIQVPPASADPCGMVPPVYLGNGSIKRIGLQKTYVFHKDGIETFVIRPGFQGNVDNFGMLIPFPNPPSLRKVPDNIFEQIANAIDPPEIVVDLNPIILERAMAFDSAEMPSVAAGLSFQEEAVVVLNQEAVGMYEVAVLQAGSAKALKKWMDQNGFRYPEGMDTVTDDYVKLGWCFVAVKTKVGNKASVNPAPGQREVNAALPAGSIFDGHVQGMGFRFKSEELVVPMRLSAFNDGDLRNIVYLLTDGPRKIRGIPEEFVVRQLKGEKLFKNVTEPLPLRIIGGTEKDISEYRQKSLKEERNPGPHNAMAKELFASDLLAVATGDLSLKHEEMEKELLRVGEFFGLRGTDIDAQNNEALLTQREKTVDQGLSLLTNMTLTVVDGDFPREVIAEDNLTFEQYSMPVAKNNTEAYQAPRFAPGGKKEGILKTSSIDWPGLQQSVRNVHTLSRIAAFSILGIGLVLVLTWCFNGKTKTALPLLLLALFFSANLASACPHGLSDIGEASPPTHSKPTDLNDMLSKLGSSKTSAAGIEELVAFAGQSEADKKLVVQALIKLVESDGEPPQKGWAIAALAKIGGSDVDEKLLDIHANQDNPGIIRTWAAAARVSMTQTTNGLIEKANLIQTFPALGRPIGLRLVEQLNGTDQPADLSKIINATIKVPQLSAALAPAIMAFGPEAIAKVAAHGNTNNLRRTAAGYLGALANQGQSSAVAELVTSELQFNEAAQAVPWKGGALFLPGIQWGKAEAQQLVGQLIRWYVWCDGRGDAESQQQIYNNLRSIQLFRTVGYKVAGPNDVNGWLVNWGNAVGKEKVRAILKEQDLLTNPKYSSALDNIQNDQ